MDTLLYPQDYQVYKLHIHIIIAGAGFLYLILGIMRLLFMSFSRSIFMKRKHSIGVSG